MVYQSDNEQGPLAINDRALIKRLIRTQSKRNGRKVTQRNDRAVYYRRNPCSSFTAGCPLNSPLSVPKKIIKRPIFFFVLFVWMILFFRDVNSVVTMTPAVTMRTHRKSTVSHLRRLASSSSSSSFMCEYLYHCIYVCVCVWVFKPFIWNRGRGAGRGDADAR